MDEVLAHRRGVCQDFAHVMLAACRVNGVPSRYVSGYVYPGDEGLRGDAAMHAWIECLLPSGVWCGFDPTNNVLASEHHVKVHVGRDYADVVPTKGVYRGPGKHRMRVSVSITH